MTIEAAETLAYDLMELHGLLPRWEFQWDNSKSRAGVCSHGDKYVGLSRGFATMNDEAKVRDTILHEIAHALCDPNEGHGNDWKRMCVKIGAKPERCYSSADVKMPAKTWKLTCQSCSKTFFRHRRKPGLHHGPCGAIKGKLRCERVA